MASLGLGRILSTPLPPMVSLRTMNCALLSMTWPPRPVMLNGLAFGRKNTPTMLFWPPPAIELLPEASVQNARSSKLLRYACDEAWVHSIGVLVAFGAVQSRTPVPARLITPLKGLL